MSAKSTRESVDGGVYRRARSVPAMVSELIPSPFHEENWHIIVPLMFFEGLQKVFRQSKVSLFVVTSLLILSSNSSSIMRRSCISTYFGNDGGSAGFLKKESGYRKSVRKFRIHRACSMDEGECTVVSKTHWPGRHHCNCCFCQVFLLPASLTSRDDESYRHCWDCCWSLVNKPHQRMYLPRANPFCVVRVVLHSNVTIMSGRTSQVTRSL